MSIEFSGTAFNHNSTSATRARTVLKKIFVREVITNPVVYRDEETFKKLFRKIKDEPPGILSDADETFKRLIRMAPRNAVIGVEITPASTSGLRIYYPLLSGHVGMPAKPGECVWAISNSLEGEFSSSGDTKSSDNVASTTELFCHGYWISRVTEPVYVDDLNFSHSDRSRFVGYSDQQVAKNDGAPAGGTQLDVKNLPKPPFPNGPLDSGPEGSTNKPGLISKQPISSDDFNSEAIYKFSLSNAQTTREPVPDFNKRPGDLVLQGSNNATIVLGEDRSVSSNGTSINYEEEEEAGAQPAPANQNFTKPRTGNQKKGTIDIVAGRSILRDANNVVFNTDQITEVTNSRNEPEKEKRTWATKENQPATKISEGDPDFINDLSRVYASMKTDGDRNLGYDPNQTFPYKSLPNIAQDAQTQPVNQKPYVIMKSDELRIIARKVDDSNLGSIRIIKEGTRVSDTDPGDQAVILMQPSGDTIIDAPRIVIGSGNQKANGQGDQVFIGGSSATEPLVLGNALKGIIEELIDAIAALTVPTGVGPSGPPVNSAQFTGIKSRLNNILSQVGKTK